MPACRNDTNKCMYFVAYDMGEKCNEEYHSICFDLWHEYRWYLILWGTPSFSLIEHYLQLKRNCNWMIAWIALATSISSLFRFFHALLVVMETNADRKCIVLIKTHHMSIERNDNNNLIVNIEAESIVRKSTNNCELSHSYDYKLENAPIQKFSRLSYHIILHMMTPLKY